jgi:hypothetical protein
VRFKFKDIESGGLFGVRLKVEVNEAMVTGIPQVKVDINELHKKLGHPCEVVAKETGTMLGLHVVGETETCSDCVMAKAKQKSVKNLSPIEEEDSDNDVVMTKLVSGICLEETSKDDEESKGETEKNASFDMPQTINKKRRIDSGNEVEYGFVGAVVSDPKEPKSFDQAWNCDTNERND